MNLESIAPAINGIKERLNLLENPQLEGKMEGTIFKAGGNELDLTDVHPSGWAKLIRIFRTNIPGGKL